MRSPTKAHGKKRVLHYVASKVRAGAEEHALSLVLSLSRYEFVPYLAAPTPLLDEFKAELGQASVTPVPVNMTSPLDLSETLRFSRFLKRERIDIVHSHMFHSTLNSVAAARVARTPIVIETCHGREAWREGKLLKGRFWIDQWISRFVDHYIAVCKAAADHLINTKGISPEKISVIHNGRDTTYFRPPTAGERTAARQALGVSDQEVVLVLGRLDYQKGHRFFIEAFANLVSKRPQAVALIAGSGPLEEALRGQSTSLGLGEKIRFLGFQSDARSLLWASDVVVLSSLHEGLPLVAIEALACGCAMVATAVDGTPEVILDGKTGLLVPPANPQELANALVRLLGDPFLRLELGRAGRCLVEAQFEVSLQIERTIALYDRLLSLKGITRQSKETPTEKRLAANRIVAVGGKRTS